VNSASSVALSPDGAHVYATSFFEDNAVTLFDRNAGTGALTFVATYKDGAGGVEGLAAATAVAVTSDGAYVVATGYVDDALAVFSRNAATGALTFVEAKKRGRSGAAGLDGASGVIVSPDSRHVYATSEDDDSLTAFGMICAGVSPGDPCDDGDPCTTDDRCTDGLCVDQAAPPLGCRKPAVSGKSLLELENRTPDTRDRVKWKWRKGQATAKAEFGSPTTTDGYALCLSDRFGVALAATVAGGGMCGGKACWRERKWGFEYRSSTLDPDGIAQILLKQGLEDGRAQITVKGKGELLAMPVPALTSSATARLTNLATGACWESP
jgi:hypothetical protein